MWLEWMRLVLLTCAFVLRLFGGFRLLPPLSFMINWGQRSIIFSHGVVDGFGPSTTWNSDRTGDNMWSNERCRDVIPIYCTQIVKSHALSTHFIFKQACSIVTLPHNTISFKPYSYNCCQACNNRLSSHIERVEITRWADDVLQGSKHHLLSYLKG